MSRQYYLNGPTLVTVNGAELCLSDQPIRLGYNFVHDPVIVDAWGPRIPPALQYFLSSIDITISMVHFDNDVLNTAWAKSMGGATAGTMTGAGTLLQNISDFFVLRFTSPIGGIPWRFPTVYCTGQSSYPLGTERSLVSVTFQAIPVPPNADPYNGGSGSNGVILFDHA